MRTVATTALVCAALLLASPDAARACAVCTGGQTEEVRYAFIWTTGLLSALPPLLVGSLIWFLRRRAREIAAAHEPPRSADEEPATAA